VSEEKKAEKVSVHVKFGDVEQTFVGTAEDVWFLVNKFFSEMMPDLEILSNIVLTVDLQRLMEDCRDIVAITPEGIAVLVPKEQLTDNEALLLHLLAGYIAQKSGLTETGVLSKEALRNGLSKSSKIISTRLGELTRKGQVVKMNNDYKISTIGIKTLQNELLPRLKAKAKGLV
jgi:DNA-binding HxlR family transcriptional regulator